MGCAFNSRKHILFLITFYIKVNTFFFGMKNEADQSFSLLRHIFIELPVLKLVSIMIIM